MPETILRSTSSRLRRLLFLGVALTTACSSATAPANPPTGGGAPAATAKPPVEQKLTYTPALFESNLHPWISLAGAARRYDIYDTVIGQAADGSAMPGITTSWKNVDPTSWDLTIRQGMKFHDGVAMKADDVAYSINRAIDPARKYAIAGRLPTIKEATVVDPATVRVTTNAPDPIILKRIAQIAVLPQAYLEAQGDDAFRQKPIGTGPFKVVDYQQGVQVKLAAVMDHPFRKPTLTEVTIKGVPDATARVAGLRSGELDLVEQLPIDQGKAFESAGFKVVAIDTGNSEGYAVDTATGDGPVSGPTRDKRVRQALNYAIDKEAIVKNIYQGYTRIENCQPVQAETYGYNPRLRPYAFDQAKAKALLAEAGYPNGFKTTLRSIRNTAVADQTALFVQSSLKEVGVDVEYVPIADSSLQGDLFFGNQARPPIFRMTLTNRPAMDADFALTWFAGTQRGGLKRYDNADFDANYLASQRELNDAKRLELLQKSLEIFCEDPPYLFLVQYSELIAGKGDIQGIEKRADREQDLSKLRRG